MPPVLGPASPSSSRLWSWATGSSSISVPSVIARTETSSPRRKVSITTVRPASPKYPVAEHRAQGSGCLRPGRADDRPLAGRETGRLDYQRLRMTSDEFERRPQLLEGPARCGGNPRLLHDLLGEGLRRLELGGGRARSEDRPSFSPKTIGESSRERHLGPDDGEIDAVHVRGVGQPVEVVGGNRKVGRQLRGAGVARRTVDVGAGVLPPKRPAEGMLPAPRSDYQQPHGFCAFLKASRARSAARRAASATWVAISRASPA